MICADPWDEVARLEAVLEAELLKRHGSPAFRSRPASVRSRAPRAAPPSLKRRDPLLDREVSLGWRYTGRTYRIRHF